MGLRELRPRIIEEEELDPERDPFSDSRGLYANISLGRSSEIRENSPMFDRNAAAGWNPQENGNTDDEPYYSARVISWII